MVKGALVVDSVDNYRYGSTERNPKMDDDDTSPPQMDGISTEVILITPTHGESPPRHIPRLPDGHIHLHGDGKGGLSTKPDQEPVESPPARTRSATLSESLKEMEEYMQDAFGRVVVLDRKREKHSQKKAKEMRIVNWNPPMASNRGDLVVGDLSCFPCPTANQRVCLCCCECLREIDEDGKENPFNHHACGCWWLSFIVFGADPSTIIEMHADDPDRYNFKTDPRDPADPRYVPQDSIARVTHGIEQFGPNGYMQPMIDKFGWATDPASGLLLTPIGAKRNYNPWEDVYKTRILDSDDFGWCRINHINAMTGPTPSILRRLYQISSGGLYILFLSLVACLLPALACGIFYGAIPMANNPTKCSWSNALTVTFLHNPIGEVAITFCHAHLLFTSVDNDLPWRPFRMYWHLLVSAYLVQVAFSCVLAATGTHTFYLFCIVGRLLGLITEQVWMCCQMSRILNFRDYRRQDIECDHTKGATYAQMEERFKAFRKFLILEFVYVAICSGYILLVQEYKDSQSYINFAFTVLSNFFRVMHRDMNFILSFMTVFGYKSMVVVFISPEFGQDLGAFITAGLEPLTTAAVALMHQMYIWIRFRSWIKKVYEPVLMSLCCKEKSNNPLAWPLHNDYNFDGRGSSTSVAEYRRTKVQYDLIKMIALIVGYGMFMAILPFLRWGANDRNFPYSNDGLDDMSVEEKNWDDDDFQNALVFSAMVVAWVTGWLFFYIRWIRCYYEPLEIVVDEWLQFLGLFYREPPKLAALNLMVSAVTMMVTRMFANYGNVWWMKHYDQFGSECDPFGAN